MNDTAGTIAVVAYIGIGSNLDDPISQVRTAIQELNRLPMSHQVSVSGLYINPPMGPQDQPDYVNAVVGLSTFLSPVELLYELQSMENMHGRKRIGEQWGPRTLDLDILLYGDLQMNESDLIIPHPGAHERPFVLYPLQDINADIEIPGKGKVEDLIEEVFIGQLQRLDA